MLHNIEPIGEARPADLLFRKVSECISRLVAEGTFARDDCIINGAYDNTLHPDTFSRRWVDPNPVEETEADFALKAREHADPCSSDLFSFTLGAEPLEDGTRTIDHYSINNNGLKLIVERRRHADLLVAAQIYREYGLPGQHGLPVESGIVYSTRHPDADMRRLEMLATVLTTAVQTSLVRSPRMTFGSPGLG